LKDSLNRNRFRSKTKLSVARTLSVSLDSALLEGENKEEEQRIDVSPLLNNKRCTTLPPRNVLWLRAKSLKLYAHIVAVKSSIMGGQSAAHREVDAELE